MAYEKLSMWAYTAVISFYKFNMSEFNIACEAIGRYGRGFKGPSDYKLRVPLLKKTYAKVNKRIEKHESWDRYGCSILRDG